MIGGGLLTGFRIPPVEAFERRRDHSEMTSSGETMTASSLMRRVCQKRFVLGHFNRHRDRRIRYVGWKYQSEAKVRSERVQTKRFGNL